MAYSGIQNKIEKKFHGIGETAVLLLLLHHAGTYRPEQLLAVLTCMSVGTYLSKCFFYLPVPFFNKRCFFFYV